MLKLVEIWLVLLLSLLLGACSQTPKPEEPGQPLAFRDFLKTDIDQVSDIHRRTIHRLLKELTKKLYKRNPKQWREHDKPSENFMLERIFRPRTVPVFSELHDVRGIAAIRLAFQGNFQGDRVLAFSAGLTAMLQKSYQDKRDFYLTDTLDAQKLYNSARNIEIAAWLLRSSTDAQGRLYLLSHSDPQGHINFSFERLLGKLIATQDNMAKIIAERQNRTIKSVVQKMIGAVFLPI